MAGPRLLERHWWPRVRAAVSVGGAVVAAWGQYRLATADPGAGTPRWGVVLLVAGAAMFALASTHRIGAAMLVPHPARPASLRAVLRAPLARYSAAGGLLAMVALLARLALGSTAAADLWLWAVSLGLCAVPFALLDRPVPRGRAWLSELIRTSWPDALALALIGGLFLRASLVDIDAWYYSIIGDEYAFYQGARNVLGNGLTRPFSQDGVYGTHPMLNVAYQAAVMAIVGDDRAGWTAATMLSVLVAMVGIYVLGRLLATRIVGLIAALMFALGHYVIAFAHIGYNNLDALPPAIWMVVFYVLAGRTGSTLTLFVAGIVGGLGLYTFYSGRIIAPIVGLFLMTGRERRARVLELWPLAFGFALAVAPIAMVAKTSLITAMLAEVPGGYASSVTGAAGERLLTNARNNLLAFNFSPTVQHYVSGSLLDPISALAAVLGTALAIWLIRYEAYRLLLIWLAISLVATGVLSPYPGVAVTRLHFCLPPLVLLAGLALVHLWRTLADGWASLPRGELGEVLLTLLALTVLWLNLDRFRVGTPRQLHLNQEAVAIGALSQSVCGNGDARNAIIARNTTSTMRPALESVRHGAELPRLIDQESLQANRPFAADGLRCVIFTEVNDPPSRQVLDDLILRYPSGTVYTFADRANKGRVTFFALPDPGRPAR